MVKKGDFMSREPAKHTKMIVTAAIISAAVICMCGQRGYALTLSDVKTAIRKTGAGWSAAENSMSSLSTQERRAVNGLKFRENGYAERAFRTMTLPAYDSSELPAAFDWRNVGGKNYVTPVKNQQYCGSCWAFASIGALESAMLIDRDTPGVALDLSEQYLVSCGGFDGCEGGYMNDPANFFSRVGAVPETCFPYRAAAGQCEPCEGAAPEAVRLADWGFVFPDLEVTVEGLKSALYAYGPLATGFLVYEDFYYYSSGVYTYAAGDYMGGHAVLLVGWDDGLQAFIVKNSWGTDWGESGYFKISYNDIASPVEFGDRTIAYGTPELDTACSALTIDPVQKPFPSGGGTGIIEISASDNCTWTAETDQGWISISGADRGAGSGTVSYTVAALPKRGFRTGSIYIGDERLTVVQPGWTAQSVDAETDAGYSSSIAAGDNGTVHIAYYDAQQEALKYAAQQGGRWDIETVDAEGNVGEECALAVDAAGIVHICYYDSTNNCLKYASKASGLWQTQTVDDDEYTGLSSSIAVDEGGSVHISYHAEELGELRYATNASGTWQVSVIDADGYPGWYTDIAVDQRGIHIAYCSYGDLMYATNVSGQWKTELIDYLGDVGIFASMDVDGAGSIHMSYYDNHNYVLKYASDTSGIWSVQTVHGVGDEGMFCDIAVDNENSAHITYYDYLTRDLMYATNSSGTWARSRIDTQGRTGQHTSIAFDDDGAMHISYYDAFFGVLRYATDRDGVTPVHTLRVSVEGTGRGTVTSMPEGIACGRDCKHALADNATVTLTAEPYSFSEFAGWFGACTGTETCTATMNESKYVKAVFNHTCPAVDLLRSRPRGLSLLRQYRDEVMAETPDGRCLTRLYYEYASELVQIFRRNAALRTEVSALLADAVPLLEARLDGDTVLLPNALRTRTASLCSRMLEHAGPELGQVLDSIRKRMEAGFAIEGLCQGLLD